jgi:L-fuculose-phosphate aldolase
LPKKDPIVEDIIKTGALLYEKDYVYATNGNISVRSRNKIYITATGLCKGELSSQDILVTDLNGKVGKGEPSIELGMHLGIYRQRPDVHAVILAHPLFTNLIGIQPGALNLGALPNMEGHLKDVSFLKFIKPGSSQLARAVTDAVGKTDIVVIHRYGTVTIADCLNNARYKLERLEYLARFSVYKQIIF